MAAASGPDPPCSSARAHPFRESSTAELGHGSAVVAGLDLEPDAVGERYYSLRAAGVPLFGDRLGAHDARLIDFFQTDTESGVSTPWSPRQRFVGRTPIGSETMWRI